MKLVSDKNPRAFIISGSTKVCWNHNSTELLRHGCVSYPTRRLPNHNRLMLVEGSAYIEAHRCAVLVEGVRDVLN